MRIKEENKEIEKACQIRLNKMSQWVAITDDYKNVS